MALFGKQNLHTAQDIMDTILTTGQMKEKEGAVEIQRKEGRKVVQTGILYFRKELVYAAHVDEMPVPIYRRLVTGKKIADPTELSAVLRNVGGDETSPDIVRRVLVNHLLSEKTLDSYVKEHFLDRVAEILSWESCVGTWMEGVTTKDFTMPNVSFRQLKAIVAKRSARYKELVEETSRFFAEEELPQVTPVSTTRNLGSMQPEVKSLLSLSAGTNTIMDIASETGLGKGSTYQMIQALWRNGNLSLRLGEITVSYKDVLEASKPESHDNAPVLETPVIELEIPADELEHQVYDESSNETTQPFAVEAEVEEPQQNAIFESSGSIEESIAESPDLVIDHVDMEPEDEVDQVDVPLVYDGSDESDFTEGTESLGQEGDHNESPTEDIDVRMDRMYAELGIDRIEYDESDSVDIDPISVDFNTSINKDKESDPVSEETTIAPESEYTSLGEDLLDEDNGMFVQHNTVGLVESTTLNVETNDVDEVKSDESSEFESGTVSSVIETADEPELSGNEMIAEEVAAEEPLDESDDLISDDSPEGAVPDGVSEASNPEDEILTDDSPITTLPQLMERLEVLKSFGEDLENEIAIANQIIKDTTAEESEARAALESVQSEADELDKKADELRRQYETVIEQIEAAYNNQTELEEVAKDASGKANEAKNRSEELISRKERVLDAIEKAAHSFSAR